MFEIFETYSGYAVLIVSIGAFIWLSSCALGEHGTKAAEGFLKSYSRYIEFKMKNQCKDIIILKPSSTKISCEHPDQRIIFDGTTLLCKCK